VIINNFMNAIDPLFQKLIEKFGDDAEEKIAGKIEEMHGLITREAAIYLLAAENELIKDKVWKGSELREGLRSITMEGKVTRIFPSWKTEKGASRRFYLDDGVEMTAVLWANTTLLDTIAIGDTVKIRNGYFKEGELHLSKPSIEVMARATRCKNNELKEGTFGNLEGTVKNKEENYYFVREGKQNVRNSFQFSDGVRESRVIGWGRDDTDALKNGDPIRIENGLMKNGELHLNYLSRVVKLDTCMKVGKIDSMEYAIGAGSGGEFIIGIAGQEFRAEKMLVLAALGLREIEGLCIEGMITLKKKEIIGKEVKFEADGEKITELQFGQASLTE